MPLTQGVEMRIEGGTLRIRSSRIASRYIGQQLLIDTGDLVEKHGDRYYLQTVRKA